MANFSTDTDLQVYQPDILGFGIASFTSPNDYHALARADIERDLRRYRTESWNVSKWYILFNYTEGVYEFVDKIQIK